MCRFFRARRKLLLPTLAETIDGLVLDPPRQGCQRPVLDALVERRVPRVVYVSCDPSTLAARSEVSVREHSSL